jgi:glutamine cyclotransferase
LRAIGGVSRKPPRAIGYDRRIESQSDFELISIRRHRFILTAAAAVSLAGLASWSQIDAGRDRRAGAVEVVAVYPHDRNAFTQGLVVHDGKLLEGTGQYGASSLRRVDIASGRVERLLPLGAAYFGEGITVLGDRIYQLTWQNRLGFIYDVESFDPRGTFRFDGEGWGLTNDGEHLILSDGTASLRFIDPETFNVVRTITARENGQPLTRLNELEYVGGEIWANIWYDDRIARLSPADGTLLGWIDLAALYPPSQRGSNDVLNGIAYEAQTRRLFVTGKNWPQLFEIKVPGL